jgi:hypothetical protein
MATGVTFTGGVGSLTGAGIPEKAATNIASKVRWKVLGIFDLITVAK